MTVLLYGLGFALAALVAFAAIWLQILVHELAHAVALWLLGGHVNQISVGSSRFVWSRSFRGCRIELRALWSHGQVLGGFVREAGLRWRWAVVYLAGPVGSTLVALAAWAASDFSLPRDPDAPLASLVLCATTVCTSAVSSSSRYAPASSNVSEPTIRFSSLT